MELIEKIRTFSARVAVIGGGYVGLPLARALATKGFSTTIYDTDRARVKEIETMDLPSRLSVSWDQEALEDRDVFVICVPTPLGRSREPDTGCVDEALERIGNVTRRDTRQQLVILESTVGPGFTRQSVPALLFGQDNVKKLDENLFVAFSPERTDPGNKLFKLRSTPKLVAGVSKPSRDLATIFYNTIVDIVIPTPTTDVAEMAKLLENTYRAVNISLVNELAMICHSRGINVWDVIDAAKTKPFGFEAFYPGPGIGGHCIGVDPLYLTWELRETKDHMRMIEAADEVNRSMPRYVVQRAQEALNAKPLPLRNARVLLLGVAYKRDVADVRESPALDVWRELEKYGALVHYHDPHVHELEVDGRRRWNTDLHEASLRTYDLIILLTDHSNVRYDVLAKAPLVLDCRNALAVRGFRSETIITL